MRQNRPRRLVMYCTALWCVQLLLAVVAVRQGWLEHSSGFLRMLEVALLGTVLLRGGVMLQEFVSAWRWKPRRSVRPSPEVVAERHRIVRDLHDGVGSQLVTTMAMLDDRNPKERRTLQDLEQCMLGMRLVIDSMEMTGAPLPDRLAGLRHRIQPVLERRGVHMQWNVQDDVDMALPSGQTAAEIFFILQEALSNVLQHSQATQVSVAMVPVPGHDMWRFEVCDNGVGLLATQADDGMGQGLGLKTMHDRASRAGIHLHCGALADGGTRVCVEVPAHRKPGTLVH